METAKILPLPINWGVVRTNAEGIEMIFGDTNVDYLLHQLTPEQRVGAIAKAKKYKHERRI